MNPVMSRINSSVKPPLTPAGYPTMPGYNPGNAQGGANSAPGGYGYTQPQPTYRPPVDDAQVQQLETAYAGRSADAVDRGQVTMDDIIIRTGVLILAVILSAAVNWMLLFSNPGLMVKLTMVSAIAALVLGVVNSFKREPSPVLILGYAIAEGLLLGGLSALFEVIYPGIVLQAVTATLVVFVVTLVLYSLRVVRNTPKLQRFALIGMVSLLVYFLVNMGMAMMGFQPLSDKTIAGIPLGLIVGVVCVVLAIISLIGDFDVCERAVKMGAPKKYAWMCAFGLLVTIIWLYINMLRIISYLRND